MAMVIQKEHLIEPHAGNDKGPRPRQAFGWASFEVTRLDNALEEQLDGFAAIGIEVMLPRLRRRRQLLGREQPAAVLGIGGDQLGPAKGRITQQQLGNRELVPGQGFVQYGAFADRAGTPAGKERDGSGKHQALQDQAIALYPAPIATLGPRRLGIHVAQPRRNAVLLPVAFMPQRALGLVHPPINSRGLGVVRLRDYIGQQLLAQGGDLGFGFRQCGVEPPLHRASMGDATKPQPLAQAVILGQQRTQLLGFEGTQHHPHHRQQQKRPAREGSRTATVGRRRGFHIVFFHLLDYPEQCVGGGRGVVGSHKPQSLQSISVLCYPRPIYAQASHYMVDAESRVILDCHLTTGAQHECTVMPERLTHLLDEGHWPIEEVSADKAYGRGPTYDFLRQHAIRAYIPLHMEHLGEGQLSRRDFVYDHKHDRNRCPQNHYLYPYAKLDHRLIKRYRMLGGHCRQCPVRVSCLPEKYQHRARFVYRSPHQDEIDRIKKQQGTPYFKRKLAERQWKAEGVFGEAKGSHGLRRAKYRGKTKMQIQLYLTAIAQNLKRLVSRV